MKIIIPKRQKGDNDTESDLIGTFNTLTMPLEMNNIDIDYLLPELLFRIVAHGRDHATRPNKRVPVAHVTAKMIADGAIELSNPAAAAVLARLAEAVLVYTTRTGKDTAEISGQKEQIQQVVPHSMLSLKAGYPPENRRLRGTDRRDFGLAGIAGDGGGRLGHPHRLGRAGHLRQRTHRHQAGAR
jgi:hypothetical protein